MASICFLTRRYDEYFKILSALALNKYTLSLENALRFEILNKFTTEIS